MMDTFEFSLGMDWCKGKCLRYCPQEIIIGKYKGEKYLSLENHKKILNAVPKSTVIIYAGYMEPFQHPDAVEMMLYTHEMGYKQRLYTSLIDCNMEKARKVCEIPFQWVELHLPDASNNLHVIDEEEHARVLMYFLRHVHTVKTMRMDGVPEHGGFQTNNTENMCRHPEQISQKNGRLICPRLKRSEYVCLPNGDVFFCCMVRGQTAKVGNIFEESYSKLRDKFPSMSIKMQKSEDSVCRICDDSYSYYKDFLIEGKEKIFGKRKLL